MGIMSVAVETPRRRSGAFDAHQPAAMTMAWKPALISDKAAKPNFGHPQKAGSMGQSSGWSPGARR
jgi:hypothetical protein